MNHFSTKEHFGQEIQDLYVKYQDKFEVVKRGFVIQDEIIKDAIIFHRN